MRTDLFPLEPLNPHISLSLLDIDVSIWSNSTAFLARLEDDYVRFIKKDGLFGISEGATQTIKCTFLAGTAHIWKQPVVIIDDEFFFINDVSALSEHNISSFVMAKVRERVQNYLLLHAGVVARNGQAVLIVADSHHGKSTLVLELVRRGFQFLSDEFAALGRDDGLVHAVPRALHIRQGTLDLVDLANAVQSSPVWQHKYLLDIDAIRPGSLCDNAAIHSVMIMRGPTANEPRAPVDLRQELVFRIEPLEDHQIAFSGEGAKGVWCLDIGYEPVANFSFDHAARLEAITKSQAVFELLSYLQTSVGSETLQTGTNDYAQRIFIELARLIRSANCYRLYVGELQAMAELVSGVLQH